MFAGLGGLGPSWGGGRTRKVGGSLPLTLLPPSSSQIEAPFLPRGPNRLGWAKKVYVGYTDATFATEIPQPAWMGFTGPTLRAEVGDTLIVKYFNNCTIDTSMHPHGLSYEVDYGDPDGANEGAWYQFFWAAAHTRDDVLPGDTVEYRWRAGVKSGPVGMGVDFSSQAWW